MSNGGQRLIATTLLLALACGLALPAMSQRERRQDDARARHVAGAFDYYTLVLSWSPTYCATGDNGNRDAQCKPRDGRRFAFVLHGLWPQYEKGWPENCRIQGRPFVPRPLIDRMLDIMPSPRLVIHEYRKHGTCSGLTPEGYYELSRRLYETISIPERYIKPDKQQFVSPEALADEFMSRNPKLKPDMLAIACDGPGNRLREVRVCFDRRGEPRACGANENQRRLCSAPRMYVPPIRGGSAAPDARDEGESPLPRPRSL